MSTYFSNEIQIGNLRLGGRQSVRIQSMTNTSTMDTQATVSQVIRLVEAGSELVRITAANIREAENLANIKDTLRQKGIKVPLIADIHFKPEAAEIAAQIVEKVRINPGNYVSSHHKNKKYTEQEYQDELLLTAEKLFPLLEICKKHETALRIGINHGSLSDRILFRYGNTPEGMVAAAMEFTDICYNSGFDKLVISLKASYVPTMITANKLLIKQFQEAGYHYPIHLGVTEAGNGMAARIKSAAGIGSLLAEGIGDTIRVSLTEPPEKEIPFAKKLVSLYGRSHQVFTEKEISFFSNGNIKNETIPLVISDKKNKNSDGTASDFKLEKTSNQFHDDKQVIKLSYNDIPHEELMIRASADFTLKATDNTIAGIWLNNGTSSTPEQLSELSLQILQATGLRYSKTEFVACPSCGRTLFDIESVLEKVKARLGEKKGLKIAVMGCVVNGPGEMAGADYGLIGAGNGKVTLYKGHKPVLKNQSLEDAVDTLVSLVENNGFSSRETENIS
ncbi:MAG: (E)-4-hydroxy-3-methylbut-2-enyl-diphosphate synthase [Bacteroidales bacterium]|nr:(E)-4-hydroxy-3-methylbut-2-enyl-diphosphate synthase [Bacteroidales bacterium]